MLAWAETQAAAWRLAAEQAAAAPKGAPEKRR
jgi:hypothetical protein